MARKIIYIFIIGIFVVFALFIKQYESTHEVLNVYNPSRIGIDLNNDKTITGEEIFQLKDIECFSTTPNEEFIEKYSKKFNITYSDIISLGYLAEEFAQKTLLHKKIKTEIDKSNPKYAKFYINSQDYSSILKHSGFAINEGEISDIKKYSKHLKNAKKLHLVVFNKHSKKYHKPDCQYAKLAEEILLLPEKQLPQEAMPCSYCIKNKKHKKHKRKNFIKNISYKIPNIKAPEQITIQGDIKLLYSDYTKHLKPNTNCDTNECKELLKLINESNETIDIAIYGYNNIPKITQALNDAKERRVKIRFIYDSAKPPAKNFYNDNNIIEEISNSSRHDDENAIMHNKFIIFDKQITYTGSMNLSPTGMSGYDTNTTIIIKSKEIADLYTKEFNQMLNGKFHNNKHKLNKNNIFKTEEGTIEIYFSPKDKTAGRIIELINNAKNNIYISAYLITHSGICEALIKAHKRGVNIKIIIDANSCTMQKSKHKDLRNAGIQLKVENYAGKMHSKTMVIDDKYLITGSMNFSNSGENKNDENTVIAENQYLVENYKNFFKYLWEMIPEEYLNKTPKAEGPESIGSCNDGIDNNFNGLIDKEESACK